MMTIDIKYHSDDMERIEKIEVGDWIDLRSENNVNLKKGEYAIISLGVSMKIPDGYEAYIVPRSSTYKNFKIIQTNSIGIIDNSYSGDGDVWGMPVLAMEDTHIPAGSRVCQFRVSKKMPEIDFNEVKHLSEKCRGGFGSTGISKFDLSEQYNEYVDDRIIDIMEELKERYNKTQDKEDYLRLLYSNPCGFKLTARMTTNYRCLKTIYCQRKDHRLDKWREFCEWIETLPYSELITGKDGSNEN